jgi:hypothetical protein
MKLDNLREEFEKGGGESPCPFCGLPRARRSDYIRCVRCGVNWIGGESLDRDPRTRRLEVFLEGIKAHKKKGDEDRKG